MVLGLAALEGCVAANQGSAQAAATLLSLKCASPTINPALDPPPPAHHLAPLQRRCWRAMWRWWLRPPSPPPPSHTCWRRTLAF